MPWHFFLRGYDTFSGDYYPLAGTYRSEVDAQKAARKFLQDVERSQPSKSSGGQHGIQDRVFIVRPDGASYRYLPNE